MPPKKKPTLWQRFKTAVAPTAAGVVAFVKAIPASVATGAVTLVDTATLGKNQTIHEAALEAQENMMQLKPAQVKVVRGVAIGAVIATSLALTVGAANQGWTAGTAAVARGSFQSATWTVAPTLATTAGGLSAAGQTTVIALAQGNPQGAAQAVNTGLSIIPGSGLPEGTVPGRPSEAPWQATPREAPPESSVELAARYAPQGGAAQVAPSSPPPSSTLGIAPALDGGVHAAQGGEPAAPGAGESPAGQTAPAPPVTHEAASASPAPTAPLGEQHEPARPDAELARLDLATIVNARRSNQGRTAGVYFCQAPNGEYAIKPPGRARTTDAELLGNLLAQELGISVPRVGAADVEFSHLRPLAENESTHDFFNDICAADRVLVMQKIEGSTLEHLDRAGAEHLLTGKQGDENLRTIGEIATFDALVGNDDRFPFLGGAGNPGNLMFAQDGRVVAIDNLPSFVPMQGELRDIVTDPRASGIPARIREYLQTHTGVDVGSAGEARIREGMSSMSRKISRLDRATVERLVDNASAKGEFKGRGSLDRFLDGVDSFKTRSSEASHGDR